jgi:hypothetical protein
MPCPFGTLLVTLYQVFSKRFLNGQRNLGSGATPQRGLAPSEKKVHPGKFGSKRACLSGADAAPPHLASRGFLLRVGMSGGRVSGGEVDREEFAG